MGCWGSSTQQQDMMNIEVKPYILQKAQTSYNMYSQTSNLKYIFESNGPPKKNPLWVRYVVMQFSSMHLWSPAPSHVHYKLNSSKI
jgi:hypothetical protein